MQNWFKEFKVKLPYNAHFLLSGNIYDSFIYSGKPMSIKKFLSNMLIEDGFDSVVIYEPGTGFIPSAGENILPSLKIPVMSCPTGKCNSNPQLLKDFEHIKKLLVSEAHNTAIIIDFASRLEQVAGNDKDIFLSMMNMEAVNSKPLFRNKRKRHNIVIYLLDKEGDMPSWYFVEKPHVFSIIVEKPDFIQRKLVVESLVSSLFPECSRDENLIKEIAKKTNGMLLREIIQVMQIAKENHIPITQISEAIRVYKTGLKESPWKEIDKETLKNLENLIKERIKGQEEAVKKTGRILKRAYFNLSGSQFSMHSTKPKGIFFLVGPTGVGKTELAKAIAESVFGTTDSIIRFDMSEYKEQHSDQKLLGSPPGYVGHNEGGQLTNAVRENPFSVILFDEIEKAHPRVLDILLQILDEGFITSGRGEKVFFDESIIIFTSNIGASSVNPSLSEEEYKNQILSHIHDYFINQIQRPELLNRIGENIIVFNFIDKETGKEIAKIMIERVLEKTKKEHGISIAIEEQSLKNIIDMATNDLSMGGRGIGNKLEEIFVNPLSESLLDIKEQAYSKIKIYFENNTIKIAEEVIC